MGASANPEDSTLRISTDDLDRTLVQSTEAVSKGRAKSLMGDAGLEAEAPKVPGYVFVSPLGRGAYAQVWKAIHQRSGKQVALKVFLDQAGVNWLMLQREVERLIRLDKHPNIVSLLDADLGHNPAYYVMDLLEVGSLEHLVRSGEAVEVHRGVKWMGEICEALVYVHGKGMIHCDLKPANVLRDDMDHVRVADFGQSRILSDSGTTLGTLYYMAPEQAIVAEAEGAHPTPQWDIFALGMTMYALFTGRVPRGDFSRGLQEAVTLKERLEKYRMIINRWPLRSVRDITRGRVNEDLSAIVAKCIESDPVKRYAKTEDILDDLARMRASRPVSPKARSRVYRTKKLVRRNRLAVGILAAASVIVATMMVQLNIQMKLRAYEQQRNQELRQAQAHQMHRYDK